jgi:hypothetical protein
LHFGTLVAVDVLLAVLRTLLKVVLAVVVVVGVAFLLIKITQLP